MTQSKPAKASASSCKSWIRHFACAALMLAGSMAVRSATADTAEVTPNYGVEYEFNVRIPMRDATVLSADIYRPKAAGKFPVLLLRTPYTKGRAGTNSYAEQGRYWASHGYVFMVQDVRGRGDSDGEFYPLINEAMDGFDTQQWAGTQPWSSGKVGTFGSSYLGWTQVYAATMRNPHLAAMVPMVTPPDPNRNFPTSFGVNMPAALMWLAGLDGHINQDLSAIDVNTVLASRPLLDMDRRFGRRLPAWHDWVEHPANDDYWRRQAYQDKLLDADRPMLHISGWYDDVLVGTTENFINMTTRSRAPQVRARQRMLIGPWGHAINAGRKLGEIDFGPAAVIDLNEILRRWFDHWLKGVDNGVDNEAPVRLFVMGRNEWVEEREWPIARTQYVKYYLRSGGSANGRNGNGVLSTAGPAEEQPDRFRFDPANPVPYLKELNWHQVGGPDDFSELELRQDILVYTGPAVTERLRICGPLRVKLFAASSARDTDWTAKVLDVHPNGFAQRLNDGVVRARFRKGNDREELLTPDKMEEYDIDAWSTCTELQKGHRLRLEIASSAFGKYDVNPNTGGPLGKETRQVIADQTVYHDRLRASYLLLPVVPPRQ